MEQLIFIVKEIKLAKVGCDLLVNTQQPNTAHAPQHKNSPIYGFYGEHAMFECGFNSSFFEY